MTTTLSKQLKRQVTVDGADYTIVVDPVGMSITGKGRRKPQVALRWQDLLSGEAALATALNASLSLNDVDARQASETQAEPQPKPAPKRSPSKRSS